MKNKFQTRNLFTAKTLQICCRATLVGVFFFLILFFAVMVTNEEQKGDERSTSEAKWMCGPKMADHRRHRNLWSRVFWRGSDPRNRGACTKKKTKKTQKMEGSAVTPVLAAVESDLIPRPSRHQLDQLVRKSRIPLPPPPHPAQLWHLSHRSILDDGGDPERPTRVLGYFLFRQNWLTSFPTSLLGNQSAVAALSTYGISFTGSSNRLFASLLWMNQ